MMGEGGGKHTMSHLRCHLSKNPANCWVAMRHSIY